MRSNYHILYVDDEEGNLNVFRVSFGYEYRISLAKSAQEAIQIVKNNDIHLIITDQRMPEMTGVQMLQVIVKDYPNVVSIIMTGYSDISAIKDAINECQIFRYLNKPWQKEDLRLTIEQALNKYQLRIDKQKLIEELKLHNENLEQTVKERTEEIIRQKNKILEQSKRELSGLQLQVQQKNELLENLKKQIRLLQNDINKTISQRMGDILGSIDTNLRTQTDWQNFNMLLEQVHEGFFVRMQEKYPKLTDNDLRICAYLRMKMTTKEIASMTATTVRGIETSRYRIRQRMGLEAEDNLLEILTTI